jgi:Tfp pilus assembly protein PilF
MSTTRIAQLLKFLEANSTDSFVRFALALEYIKAGEEQQALEYFSDIRKDDPDYTGTYYHLGKLYEHMNKKKEAEETYREGLKRTIGKDGKSYQEIQEALNQLLYEEEE